LSVARAVKRKAEARSQEPEARSQNITRQPLQQIFFSFLLAPGFWLLASAFRPGFWLLLFLDTLWLTGQYPGPTVGLSKGNRMIMNKPNGRSGARLTALLLLASLTFASCQMLRKLGGSSGMDEANQLNQSAGEDIKEIEKLVQENKDKESEISRALNVNNYDAAKRAMDDSVKAIDRGLEKGQNAADKLDKASKLDIDPKIKEYLSLRAQSVNKAIEAFRELRQGLIALRDSTGSMDKSATEKAKNEIQQSSTKFDELINESEKLERQADEIARRNPDKIKPGR
jgi:hypothetical protein